MQRIDKAWLMAPCYHFKQNRTYKHKPIDKWTVSNICFGFVSSEQNKEQKKRYMNIFVYHSLTFGRYLSRAYIYFMSSLKTPNKSHAIHDWMAYFAVFVFTHFCGRTYSKSKTKILPNTWMQNKEQARESEKQHIRNAKPNRITRSLVH